MKIDILAILLFLYEVLPWFISTIVAVLIIRKHEKEDKKDEIIC